MSLACLARSLTCDKLLTVQPSIECYSPKRVQSSFPVYSTTVFEGQLSDSATRPGVLPGSESWSSSFTKGTVHMEVKREEADNMTFNDVRENQRSEGTNRSVNILLEF